MVGGLKCFVVVVDLLFVLGGGGNKDDFLLISGVIVIWVRFGCHFSGTFKFSKKVQTLLSVLGASMNVVVWCGDRSYHSSQHSVKPAKEKRR